MAKLTLNTYKHIYTKIWYVGIRVEKYLENLPIECNDYANQQTTFIILWIPIVMLIFILKRGEE